MTSTWGTFKFYGHLVNACRGVRVVGLDQKD
jgi:hypothetical protein